MSFIPATPHNPTSPGCSSRHQPQGLPTLTASPTTVPVRSPRHPLHSAPVLAASFTQIRSVPGLATSSTTWGPVLAASSTEQCTGACYVTSECSATPHVILHVDYTPDALLQSTGGERIAVFAVYRGRAHSRLIVSSKIKIQTPHATD
jgi:hypothetical protein